LDSTNLRGGIRPRAEHGPLAPYGPRNGVQADG